VGPLGPRRGAHVVDEDVPAVGLLFIRQAVAVVVAEGAPVVGVGRVAAQFLFDAVGHAVAVGVGVERVGEDVFRHGAAHRRDVETAELLVVGDAVAVGVGVERVGHEVVGFEALVPGGGVGAVPRRVEVVGRARQGRLDEAVRVAAQNGGGLLGVAQAV